MIVSRLDRLKQKAVSIYSVPHFGLPIYLWISRLSDSRKLMIHPKNYGDSFAVNFRRCTCYGKL